jgi:uncharacterized Tic20 family protein
MTSKQAGPGAGSPAAGPVPAEKVPAEKVPAEKVPAEPVLAEAWVPTSDGEARTAMFGYLGAIVTGPLIPLAVYAVARRRSWYLRAHSARAVNLSVTGLLYLVCCAILCGLLTLDNLTVALVVAGGIASFFWFSMLGHLIRGSVAANHGESYAVPAWLCAQVAKP